MFQALIQKYGPEPAKGVLPQHRTRLLAFFEKYDPSQISIVDQILLDNAGKEESLFEHLVSKFGPEPDPASLVRLTSTNSNAPDGFAPDPIWLKRIERMFEKYEPGKVHRAPAMLSKYQGREQELLEALVAKYGPEPPSEQPKADESTSTRRLTTADRVRRFYEHYDPSMLPKVDSVVARYEGKESVLFEALEAKYGPEPSDPQSGGKALEGGAQKEVQVDEAAIDALAPGLSPEEKKEFESIRASEGVSLEELRQQPKVLSLLVRLARSRPAGEPGGNQPGSAKKAKAAAPNLPAILELVASEAEERRKVDEWDFEEREILLACRRRGRALHRVASTARALHVL